MAAKARIGPSVRLTVKDDSNVSAAICRSGISMSAVESDAPYWSQDARELLAALGSGSGGLSSERAAATLAVVGPNSVDDASRLSALRLLLRQFESPLVLILVFAAAISCCFYAVGRRRDHPGDRSGQFAARLFSGIPRVDRGRGAETRLALMCRVIRRRRRADGTRRARSCPATSSCSRPATWFRPTGSCIEAADFLVSEASLTGESFPVEKQPGIVAADDADHGAHQCGVSRHLGAQRHGQGPRRQDRQPTEFGAIAARLQSAAARDRFRARRAAVRLSARARDGAHRALRADREPAARPAGRSSRCCSPSRWRSVCRRSCCRRSSA